MYTGPGPVKDVFSTTNRMTVLFVTNDALTKRGFKANFTTGYGLGIPGKYTWDYVLHCNFWSKTIKADRTLRPLYVSMFAFYKTLIFFLLTEIFFLPLHLFNHYLNMFKAGIHIVFSANLFGPLLVCEESVDFIH